MGVLDGMLSQLGGDATVDNLAAKFGLPADKVETAMAALSQAHQEEGDTVQSAAASTGLPPEKLSQIVDHIGGEGALGQFASLLQGNEGGEGMLGRFKNML
ncbi:hypothetical protein ABDK56_11990 [Sphingomonas sp. ASV193]|uniref:hypothetical protein n=1 Tax=Sphingomonas sp. ASV193 TaxID=3144405 RepID=UPI0032E8908D